MEYSHSRLSTFEQCPLKFKFRYIDGIKPEGEEIIETFLGSRVHETLEWLYKNVKMCKIPTLNECIKFYSDDWKKNFNKTIVINSEFSEKDYFNKGKKCIEDYYNRYSPFEENTIATEKQVRVVLDSKGKCKIIGYIDRLVYNNKTNSYEIHDYKTNNRLKEQSDLEEDRQLALYAIALKNMYQDAQKVELIWHFLSFDKEFKVFKTDKQLKELKESIIKLIHTIEETKEFAPHVSGLCDWCDYQPQCPKFKHLFELKKATPNEYLKDDGVKLVNNYAQIIFDKKQFIKKVEAEQELLEEAIISYAKKQKIDVVFGSNNKVSVKFTEKFKFPGKNTPEREELDKFIKSLHKWNEVSVIDTYALEKVIESNEWPKEIISKLKKFAELEKSEKVSLSKLDNVTKD